MIKYLFLWLSIGTLGSLYAHRSLEELLQIDSELLSDEQVLKQLEELIQDNPGLTQDEIQLILEKISQQDDEAILKKVKNKKLCNLLVTNCLKVCGQTILNDLTVNGTFSGNISPTTICGVPACTIASLIAGATSEDIPDTLVLRDGGSFAATTITLTGVLNLEGSSGNIVTLQAPAFSDYTLILPLGAGTPGYVLTTDGANPDQLTWSPLMGVVTGTIQLYGDVIGSSTANTVKTICGSSACGLINTITTATSNDIHSTLVLRDNTGSFASTNITLTGCLMLNDSTNALAGKICGSTSALAVAPQGTRALQASTGGNTRGTNAVDLQINNGTNTIASGNYSVISGGASNTAQGQYDVIAGGQSNTTSITSNDPQAGYNMIAGGASNSITVNDIATETNFCGYNIVGGASNSIIISTTAAAVSGIVAGYNNIMGGIENSITVVVPSTLQTPNTIVQNITVGDGPQGIAITPNGQYAYVANNSDNSVSVINLATSNVTTIDGFSGPTQIAITPNGEYAYVTNSSGNSVGVINLATNNVTTIGGFSGPVGIAIAPNGQYAYVANNDNNSGTTVSIINLATNTITGTIPDLAAPYGIAITPNGQYAYVTNNGGTSISVINLTTYGIVNINVGVTGARQIAITPNGQYAYVGQDGGPTGIYVIDTATNKVIATLSYPSIESTNGVAITPNGQYAYAADSIQNTTILIDTTTNAVIKTINGFDSPYGAAISPNGQFLYVVNNGNATVSVIPIMLTQGENFIGGGAQNSITISPQPASIGQHVIVGGYSNTITCTAYNYSVGSFIGGGGNNTIVSSPGVISGGYLNTISQGAYLSTIGGGQSNIASGPFTTIAGGYSNIATGTCAAILGGYSNQASGSYSVALGEYANAANNNSFVWSDGSTIFTTTAANTFSVLATNGARFITDSTLSTGVILNAGGASWNSTSDKSVKENYQVLDKIEILEKLVELPVEAWNLKAESPKVKHVGPYAQDFYAAFGLGNNDRYINSSDIDGVTIAAIQGLYMLHGQKIARLEEEIAQLKMKLEELIQ